MPHLLQLTQLLILYAIPIIFAVTVHEVAHGWLASKLGDSTAKLLGRITLNPLKHIDALGTIVVPIALVSLTGVLFGWAKPVPVNWQNLRRPRRDQALVALAGPVANLLMIILWAIITRVAIQLYPFSPTAATSFITMGQIGISINLILFLFNLIPIPPLDGSRILASCLPPKIARQYERIEPYGLFLLVALLLLGLLTPLFNPLINLLQIIITRGFSL